MREGAQGISPAAQLTPETLRQAVRRKGNIVKADEVTEVLDYVTREGQHGDLHKLYLILAADNSVHKFVCCQPGLSQHKRLWVPPQQAVLAWQGRHG